MEKDIVVKNFVYYRKKIYAQINSYKGNMINLKRTRLLSKREKELLGNVIDALEELRVEYSNNRKKAEEYKKINKLPEYVTLNDIALRLIYTYYYRDGGAWDVSFNKKLFKSTGKLVSVSQFYKQLDGLEMTPCSYETYKESNGQYALTEEECKRSNSYKDGLES